MTRDVDNSPDNLQEVFRPPLLRPLDSSGPALWSGYITVGATPMAAAYRIQTAPPRYEYRITQVELNYLTILRRQADSEGLTAFGKNEL